MPFQPDRSCSEAAGYNGAALPWQATSWARPRGFLGLNRLPTAGYLDTEIANSLMPRSIMR